MSRTDKETLLRRELEQKHFPKKPRPPKDLLDRMWSLAYEHWAEGSYDWPNTTRGIAETYEFLVELLNRPCN